MKTFIKYKTCLIGTLNDSLYKIKKQLVSLYELSKFQVMIEKIEKLLVKIFCILQTSNHI